MKANSYFLICLGKKGERIMKGLSCVRFQIGFVLDKFLVDILKNIRL